MKPTQLQSMQTWPFWKGVFRVFFENKGTDSVASLSYTTIISIVPMLAVILSVFTATELFQDLSQQVMKELFAHILPTSSSEVEAYLLQFSQQASKLKGISLLIILLTTVALLWTIDKKINSFWPARPPRKWWISLVHYLGVALVGPLFLGISLMLSSYLTAFPFVNDLMNTEEWGIGFQFSLLAFMPFLLNWIGFSILYRFVPTAKVSWQSARWAALIASLAIELLKSGFTLYITWFPTYDLIYGAFAAIPIFLLWMYLNWFVVLFSAALLKQLETYRTANETESTL